ncbi:MAG: ABC transporter permease [Acidobacteria bacterium]|nr:ABC transporter permease [Acidobacteriota bacterium]
MAMLLSYNVRNVVVRWRVSSLAVGGIALVVAVLIVLVAMSTGFRETLAATGSLDNAILTQRGSASELTSGLSLTEIAFLTVDPHVARRADGTPLASPEMVVVANMERRVDGKPTNVLVRGITPMAFEVRRDVRLVEGRWFEGGKTEIVVGKRIRERVAGLEPGSVISLQRRQWRVVGVFEAEGSGFESEIWGDADVMRPAFNRAQGYQSLTVRVRDPLAIEGWATDLEKSPFLRATAKNERQYYADQAGPLATLLLFLAGFVSTVMGVGAAFGAMNTMNGIIATRTREVGTLRALGFPRLRILFAFLAEATMLAFAGGVLGVLIALPFDGLESAVGNQFSELAFSFRVTADAIVTGLVVAVSMGVFGGLLPAWRASRIPITAALRDA